MPASRRDFVRCSGAIVAGAVLRRPSTSRMRPGADIVLRGGTVFDGTGADGRDADVAISGDRVTAIGASLPIRGAAEIDVRGLAVAPGFVDIHSHADASLAADPRAESVIRQGITTIVVGADGSSRASGAVHDSFRAMFTRLERLGASPNVASMIGLGTIRASVVGNRNRPASASELSTMVSMVERALADGACGASSGLEYTPGAFASTAELSALCTPLNRRGLCYATHMRNEDDHVLDSIAESIAVARAARCGLQISHLKMQGPRNWSRLDAAFAAIESARSDGIDIAFDRYPYIAYATTLMNLFPVWARDGSFGAFIARLDDPATAARIESETIAKILLIGGWNNVQITAVSSPSDRDAEGKRLGVWAETTKRSPFAALVALIRTSRGNVDMAGFAMSEENLERILAHPLSMVCTDGGGFAVDGPTRHGRPHPRGAGSFPRVFARYVRERKVLTLAAAIARCTSVPADRVRLADRGRLAVGSAADVVVFDPSRIADTATFERPFQYPLGISIVIVNGRIVLRDNHRSGARSGRVLRSNPRGDR